MSGPDDIAAQLRSRAAAYNELLPGDRYFYGVHDEEEDLEAADEIDSLRARLSEAEKLKSRCLEIIDDDFDRRVTAERERDEARAEIETLKTAADLRRRDISQQARDLDEAEATIERLKRALEDIKAWDRGYDEVWRIANAALATGPWAESLGPDHRPDPAPTESDAT